MNRDHHLEMALLHTRLAAEAHGLELDDAMRELGTAFTALKRAQKELALRGEQDASGVPAPAPEPLTNSSTLEMEPVGQSAVADPLGGRFSQGVGR